MKLAVKIIFLILGVALFGWFLRQTDPDRVLAAFSNLGWMAPLALVPYALVYLADTWGWHFAFGQQEPKPPRYWRLLSIRWAGDSINQVVPSGYVGGEALKVYLAGRHGISISRAMSSVVVGKTVQSLCHAVYIALASCAFLQLTSAGEDFHQAMWFVCAGSMGVVLIALRVQTYGLFRLGFRLLDGAGLQWKRLIDQKSRLLNIDGFIGNFYRKDRRSFFLSGVFYMLGWLLDTFEIYVISHLADMPVSLTQALAIEGFIAVVKAMGFFIPGSLGIQETGILFLCRQAGVPDAFAGAYALIRRGREVLFAMAGLAILYSQDSNWQQWGRNRRTNTQSIE